MAKDIEQLSDLLSPGFFFDRLQRIDTEYSMESLTDDVLKTMANDMDIDDNVAYLAWAIHRRRQRTTRYMKDLAKHKAENPYIPPAPPPADPNRL